MTINKTQLIEEFGRAVYQHSAAVFVGAGLSIDAGYPDWDDLIKDIRVEAGVPESIKDAPLAAEYAQVELGPDVFAKKLLQKLVSVTPTLPRTVELLAQLPVVDYWTTNFDNLLEDALAEPFTRVVRDEDFAKERDVAARKHITKMHGSLSRSPVGHQVWQSDPVITRGDFERYEYEHPVVWSLLKAQFLTNSFIFMGLSFDDPNVGVLLRISRSLPQSLPRPPHFAVLRNKKNPDEARAFELLVADLERSGIRVCLIDEFAELSEIVDDLIRRSKAPNLFLSGSSFDDKARSVASTIGAWLSEVGPELALTSLAGDAGLSISGGFFEALGSAEYVPDRIRFYFRAQKGKAAPDHPKRMGSCIYTEMETEPMRTSVLREARAVLVMGGGARTALEVDEALSLGLPVIPVPYIDGVGRDLWSSKTLVELGLDGLVDQETWERLGSTDSNVVCRAVKQAVSNTMFLS